MQAVALEKFSEYGVMTFGPSHMTRNMFLKVVCLSLLVWMVTSPFHVEFAKSVCHIDVWKLLTFGMDLIQNS